MPELAEVEFYRKQWSPGIGETVREVMVHPRARIFRETDPQGIVAALTGSTLDGSESHGKQMCFRFSGHAWLGLHLGMSGSLQTAAKEIVPSRHEHLVLRTGRQALVFTDPRMFGRVRFHQGTSAPDWWSGLPPQPQDPEFDGRRLARAVRQHPRQPLKGLLLDQSWFPGIGNWMADEILWRARIHPATPAGELSSHRRRELLRGIKSVCDDALRVIGTDWGDPPEDWLFNHRWKRGGICPATGEPLEYATIAGRTTCFSPARQKP